MRDPARIERVLDALRKVWTESPDMRLGQIMVGLTDCASPNDVFGQLLHMEDDELEKRIKELFIK